MRNYRKTEFFHLVLVYPQGYIVYNVLLAMVVPVVISLRGIGSVNRQEDENEAIN